MTEERKMTTLHWINQAKYFMIYQSDIGTQLDLTQVMTLNKKVKAQLLSLIGHIWEIMLDVNCELQWIVKRRQTVLQNSVCN